MKYLTPSVNSTLVVVFCAAALGTLGCEDASPCDPGQIYEYQACLDPPEEEPAAETPEPAPEPSAEPATDAGMGDAGGEGMAEEPEEEPADVMFGQECADTEASSDCGGDAPICLPQIFVCSNILCQAGEPNEGICPAGWICLVADPSQPSVCLDPSFLQ